MEKIINPINFDPPIKGYLGYAIPLGIVFAKDNSYLPSLYNNYIMTISKKDFSTFEQADNDWMLQKEGVFKVNTMVLPKYLLQSRDDILELMLQLLENKSYILTKSNEYYIPDRNAYKKFNFDHENLVYGCDMEKQQFNVASYKNDGYYGGSLIRFDEYFDALKYNEFTDFTFNILTKVTDYKPRFDIEKCSSYLCDYLSGSNRKYDLSQDKYCFGIDAVKNLYFYIEHIKDSEKELAVRYFYFLWEHKKLMYDRIKYMTENGYVKGKLNLYNEYYQAVNASEMIKNLSLKYNIKHDDNTLIRIQNLLCSVIKNDEKILAKLIENIVDK